MSRSEQILWAMNDLGDDILDMTEKAVFDKPLWQRLLPAAACVLLVVGVWWLLPSMQPTVSEESLLQPVEPEEYTSKQEEKPPVSEVPVWEPEKLPCYPLQLPSGGCVAVSADGTEILRKDTGTMSLLTDHATGEILAIRHTENLENPDVETTITFYDLNGKKLEQISAWSVEILGELVMVNHQYNAFSLYRRSDGSVLLEHADQLWLQGDTCLAEPAQGYYHVGLWNEKGEQIATTDWGTRFGLSEVWNGIGYYETYSMGQSADGGWMAENCGIMDGRGNVLAEQIYDDTRVMSNGYGACVSSTETLVLDLDTGECVAQLPVDCGVVLGAYENLLLVSHDGNVRTVNQALLWDGTAITDVAQEITVIDEEGDGIAEVLQVWDGVSTTYLEPDGSILLQVEGKAQAISPRTVLQIHNGLQLLNLQNNERIVLDTYTHAVPFWPSRVEGDFVTGLLFASRTDADGIRHTDILREDGTLVLENYANEPNMRGYTGEQDGVFAVEGGFRHIDGTWLYRFE